MPSLTTYTVTTTPGPSSSQCSPAHLTYDANKAVVYYVEERLTLSRCSVKLCWINE